MQLARKVVSGGKVVAGVKEYPGGHYKHSYREWCLFCTSFTEIYDRAVKAGDSVTQCYNVLHCALMETLASHFIILSHMS